jgi:hypothetical protein
VVDRQQVDSQLKQKKDEYDSKNCDIYTLYK